MFFKKKSSIPSNQVSNLSSLFIELGNEIYKGMGPLDTTASLNVTLEFDDNQRVSVIKNP